MLTRIFLIFLLFVSSMEGGYADESLIYIATEDNLSKDKELIIREFVDKLSESLPGRSFQYVIPVTAGKLSGTNKVIVALGEESLLEVIKGKGNSPVIAAFISRPSYEEVLVNKNIDRPVTAVFSDPSPRRQIALIKALAGESATVGVIETPGTRKEVEEAKAAAKDLDVKVKVVDLEKYRTPKAVVESLSNTRMLLLQKDRAVFKQIPLDTLLVLAYDINNMGIIGYSSGVVKNGALATTYTSLNDTAHSVASVVERLKNTNKLPTPDYAQFYSVSVNKYVVRSLALVEQDSELIKRDIALLLRGAK
ncbi:MAG: hypothetical protein G8D89_18310 [gamma proteobacterium symbiont of Clathrolucina costata]